MDPVVIGEGEDTDDEEYVLATLYDDDPPDTDKTDNKGEMYKLQHEVDVLRKELVQCKQTIQKLQEREKDLKERLSTYAQKEIRMSTRFEDINMTSPRPTELIRKYGDLYSESRLDVIDALDSLPGIAGYEDIEGKLLFSVVALSFRSATNSLNTLQSKLKSLLSMEVTNNTTPSKCQAIKSLSNEISHYLCAQHHVYDVTENIDEVCAQVYKTLFDYPSLKSCAGLRHYIEDCVRIAWSLSVQRPAYVIRYDTQFFDGGIHNRFHTSDPDSNVIKMVLWPPLFEGQEGCCVYKGVVLT